MTDAEEGGDYYSEDASNIQQPSTPTKAPMKFLGVCDARIACLFVNGFNISMIVLGVLTVGIRDNLFWKAMGRALEAGLPGLLLSGIGLYGAINFELWAMYLACAGFFVAFLMDCIMMSLVGIVVTLIVLVPHVLLMIEIRNGVLTKDNYHQQEYLNESGRDFVEKASGYFFPADEKDIFSSANENAKDTNKQQEQHAHTMT